MQLAIEVYLVRNCLTRDIVRNEPYKSYAKSPMELSNYWNKSLVFNGSRICRQAEKIHKYESTCKAACVACGVHT